MGSRKDWPSTARYNYLLNNFTFTQLTWKSSFIRLHVSNDMDKYLFVHCRLIHFDLIWEILIFCFQVPPQYLVSTINSNQNGVTRQNTKCQNQILNLPTTLHLRHIQTMHSLENTMPQRKNYLVISILIASTKIYHWETRM